MYKTYAVYYDQFYQTKDYEKETLFLNSLLKENKIKTLLDVGCGTGTHLSRLEREGYLCEGIDFNAEMLNIAKLKVKGNLLQADMRSFNLSKKFDAITSLFAVFNHNLTDEDAVSTLTCFHAHLSPGGLLVLDLHNPQSAGKKVNTHGKISRVMEWQIHKENQLCQSIVRFIEGDKVSEQNFPLKIYTFESISDLLEQAGFHQVQFYDNFTSTEGTPTSKNLVVTAKKSRKASS